MFEIREILTVNRWRGLNSSTESTISTSLIHNMASERKSEQELAWVLNLIFQNENDDGVVNFV